MYIVLHILQSQASKHAHRHVRTHVHTHTHARAHSTHVNMFIITNKRSSLYIQTVFSLACLLYCKGGNLYCTRVLPLYLFNVFFSMLTIFLVRAFHLYAFLFSLLNTCLYGFLCKNGNAHHFGGISIYITCGSTLCYVNIYMYVYTDVIFVSNIKCLN